MLTLKLKDGTEFQNVEQDGNIYVFDKEIDTSIFTLSNLSEISVTDDETGNTQTLKNQRISSTWIEENRTRLVTTQLTAQEVETKKLHKVLSMLLTGTEDAELDTLVETAQVYAETMKLDL